MRWRLMMRDTGYTILRPEGPNNETRWWKLVRNSDLRKFYRGERNWIPSEDHPNHISAKQSLQRILNARK